VIDVLYKTTKIAKIEKNIGVIKPEAISSFSIPFNYQITSLPPTNVLQMAVEINQNGQNKLTFGVNFIFVPISVPIKFDKAINYHLFYLANENISFFFEEDCIYFMFSEIQIPIH
jgi:hypothetical protein